MLALLLVLGCAAQPLTNISGLPGTMPVAMNIHDGSIRVVLSESYTLMQVWHAHVENPTVWTLHGNFNLPRNGATFVALEGDLLAASLSNDGFNLYDMESPGDPIFNQSDKTCFGIAIYNGTVYCGGGYDSDRRPVPVVMAWEEDHGQWVQTFNVSAPKFGGILGTFAWKIDVGAHVMLLGDPGAQLGTHGDEGAVFVYTREKDGPWEYRALFMGTDGGQEFGGGLALAPDEMSFFGGSHYSGGLQQFFCDQSRVNWKRVAVYQDPVNPRGFMGHSVRFVGQNQIVVLGDNTLYMYSRVPDAEASASWAWEYDPLPISLNPWFPGLLSSAWSVSNETETAFFAVVNRDLTLVEIYQPEYRNPNYTAPPTPAQKDPPDNMTLDIIIIAGGGGLLLVCGLVFAIAQCRDKNKEAYTALTKIDE